MKIFRIQKTPKVQNSIPTPPISYDRNNVTKKEFSEYIQYLATNKINKTIQEPDRFVTESERKGKNAFKEFVKYLAENKINKTFITKV